ncbi:MAG: GGDEF domain-containing protein [Acidimicrobiales bacterium]
MEGLGDADIPAEVLVEGILQSRHMLTVTDQNGVVAFANEAFRDVGWEPHELIGRSPFEFVHPDDLERALMGLETVGEAPRPIPTTFRLLRGDGTYEALEVGASRVHVADRDWLVFMFSRSPFQTTAAHVLGLLARGAGGPEALDALATDLAEVIPGLEIGVAFDAVDGRRSVAGALPPALVGVVDGVQDLDERTPWGEAVATGGSVAVQDLDELLARGEALGPVVELARARGIEGGSIFPIDDPASATPALLACWYRPPRVRMFMDIYLSELPVDIVRLTLTSRYEQAELERLARQDSLTGLANRTAFFSALERSARVHDRRTTQLRAGAEPGEAVAVVYLDLDGFKPVNDTHGHEAGDAVLATLAERFGVTVRGSDLVARIGGDEFAVLCDGVRDADEACRLAERLVAVAAEPIPIAASSADGSRPGDAVVLVGASAGVAVADDLTAVAPDRLIAAADAALYRAKRAGKGRVEHVLVGPDDA